MKKSGIRSSSIKEGALVCMALAFLLFAALGLHVHAADDAGETLGILYTLNEDAEVKESPDENADMVGLLPAGTSVIVESEDDTWCRVIYQDIEGYVPSGALTAYTAPDAEGLATEINGAGEEEQRFVDEAEIYYREKRTSLIWGIVIAALIIAIFGLGVVSAVKNAKTGENGKKGSASEKKETDAGTPGASRRKDMADEIVIEDMDEEDG